MTFETDVKGPAFLLHAKRRLRNRVCRSPLYPRLAMLAGHLGYAEASSADVVIDGPTRSGNSFAEAVCRLVLPGIHVVHHTHAPATFHWGVQRNLSCVILIREPDNVAASMIVERPDIYDWKLAYQEWSDFYDSCEPIRNRLFVCSFEHLTRQTTEFVSELINLLDVTEAQNTLTPDLKANAMTLVDRLATERVGIKHTNYSSEVPKAEAKDRAKRKECLLRESAEIASKERMHAKIVYEQWISSACG